MGDSGLRSLERQWRESRSVEAEAAYCSALVRTGRLSRPRLVIAAVCGDRAARTVFADAPQVTTPTVSWLRRRIEPLQNHKKGWSELHRWLTVFDDYDACAGILMRVECANVALPIFESKHGDTRPRELLAANEDWADCPCRVHSEAVDVAFERVASLMESMGTETPSGSAAQASIRISIAGQGWSRKPADPWFLVHCLQGTRLDPWEVIGAVSKSVESATQLLESTTGTRAIRRGTIPSSS